MNLIIVIGSGAVGKMTVSQELMKITDYRLFHNHMMIEPVIDIFGKFNGAVVNKLRDCIFDEYINSDNEGLIFTYMWAFDMQSDWDYINGLYEKFKATGGNVYFVELVADQAVRIERNKTPNRLENKASKRNIELSENRLLREDSKYRLVSREGEIPYENYIRIDNTYMNPSVAARLIKDHFDLPGKKRVAYDAVKLDTVFENELEIFHQMQIESFMPLYMKYKDDETNPAKESFKRLSDKYKDPNRRYMFILYHGARVGAVTVCSKDLNDLNILTISPIFILPKYQNMGIGYAALKRVFETFPDATKWKLATIQEEPANCHLYEKCGFIRTGESHKVNEDMTLVCYEK